MTILAAIDEERNENVVTIADDLARAYDDDLVVLHVIPKEDFESYKRSVENINDYKDFSITQRMDSAAQFARRVTKAALGEFDEDRISTRGRIGNASDKILEEESNIGPRYLVLGGRRRSPTGKALFGDTTQEVLLNADCPVVTNMRE